MRMLSLLLLLGCPKKPEVTANLWETTPRLPAPAAGAYTRSPEAPTDTAIAKLVHGKQWEASLSGAAGGLAVQLSNPNGPKALTRWAVREALWRAGYPYPIQDAKAWLANEDGSPPPQLLLWLEGVPADVDLGLVRSRGHYEDVFVALVAKPKLDLGAPIPRQVATGGTLRLPALAGGTYTIADANGRVLTGSLEKGAEIDTPTQGEWLVEVRTPQASTTFPVYVGIVPPHTSLIEKTASVRDEQDVLGRATEVLERIRDAYGSPVPSRDFMLDAGARTLLDPEKPTPEVLESLGIEPKNAAVWRCSGQTVEVCMDRMVWRPENRLALLDDDARVGLAATMDAGGMQLVGILTRTD